MSCHSASTSSLSPYRFCLLRSLRRARPVVPFCPIEQFLVDDGLWSVLGNASVSAGVVYEMVELWDGGSDAGVQRRGAVGIF